MGPHVATIPFARAALAQVTRDAATYDEFKKILASRPDEARVHLALANIYAQTLHDTSLARRHYLKVLELEPDSPQASDIRFWLAGNPD